MFLFSSKSWKCLFVRTAADVWKFGNILDSRGYAVVGEEGEKDRHRLWILKKDLDGVKLVAKECNVVFDIGG